MNLHPVGTSFALIFKEITHRFLKERWAFREFYKLFLIQLSPYKTWGFSS